MPDYLVEVYYHEEVYTYDVHDEASLEFLRTVLDCNAEIEVKVIPID